MSPTNSAVLEDEPMTTTGSESSRCLCGVPSCPGHQMVEGEIHIPDHPLGYLIVHQGNLPASKGD